MKKSTALSIAAVMVLSMVGCSSKPAEMTTADITTATEAATDTSMADTTAAESAVGATASGKKYVINTDTTLTPFEFENEEGKMVGIDLDILKTIAQDQGFEYGVIPVGSSAAYIVLESGECNGVIAGMPITGKRIQKYDFSEPYCDFGVGVAALSSSDVAAYSQLKGQNVTAKTGAERYTFAESIADQYGSEVTQYGSPSDIYQVVFSGEAVVCFEDYPVIGYEISRGLELTLPTDIEKGSSYGFAALKGANPELIDVFNRELENIEADGRYEEILNIYIAK